MHPSRHVFIVGGTGFLGMYAVREFLKKGWQVTALGLPPAPPPELLPPSVKLVIQDLEQAPDDLLLELMSGHDALVFAAGMDDRVTPRRPAYPAFFHANVEVPVHILTLARQAGIRKAVVLGSYFTHFDRLWPELRLAERHAYIRSRVEQEQAVTAIPGLEVDVLELPYIFGDPLGRKPLWVPLVKYLRAAPLVFYMHGGTACITARTVGQAIVGALEHDQAGACYPIGDENLHWPELLARLGRADGRKVRVVTLPTFLIKAGLPILGLIHWLQGRESGLDPRHFAALQTAETFLDPKFSQRVLGYETGGLDQALEETVKAC
jgi:dihydroflavonol-4-reductase